MRLRRLVRPTLVLAAVLVQFAPVLAGRVYRFEDIAGYFEPLWTAVARAMRAGRMPVWEMGGWSGEPLLGDPQVGAFYPPNWLWLTLPILRAYAVLVLVHALWAGLGMYALVRARGRSREAAALAGIALAVGGYVVLQVRHVLFVEATAWLPWVVLCGWRALDGTGGGRRRWLAGMALALGLLLATGGVSMINYGLWFVAAVLLPRALAADGPARERAARVAGLGLAGLLGVALAAAMLAPALFHEALSPRARGTEYAFAASVSWPDWRYLPSLFLPNLLGQEVRGSYRGGGTQWEVAGYYAGMLPFALAALALFGGPRERRGERCALGAICLLALFLAPGAHSPFHRLAFRFLPLYGSMRCPPRALYVFALAVPLLAADGLDRALGIGARRWRLPAARAGWVGLVAVALTAADLLVTHRAENPTTTLAAARAAAFPPARDFFAAYPGDRFVNDVHGRHELHNAGFLWGVDGASGYAPLPIWRYLHYLWIANHGAVYPYPKLHDDLSAQGLWRLGSPLVDALAVRFVVGERAPGPAHFVRRYAGPDGLDVYENLHAAPRAWVVHRAEVVAGADAAALAIAATGFDPRRSVVLEEAPVPAPAGGGGEPVDRVDTGDPRRRRYRVDFAAPGLLVMAEPCYPGWSATVDGATARPLCADYALSAVAVPAGRHEIELAFASRPADRGAAVSLVALLALGLLAFFPGGRAAGARSCPRPDDEQLLRRDCAHP